PRAAPRRMPRRLPMPGPRWWPRSPVYRYDSAMSRSGSRRTLASLLAAGFLLASAFPVAATVRPVSTPVATPATAGLRPGSVNRTSKNLRAEYTVTVHLSFGRRTFDVDEIVAATNPSGVAIDRLELNTAVARLGGLRITGASVAGKAVHPTITDQ